MPEIERDELALIYQAKGIDAEHAQNLATQVMADPEQMLAEQVQEELGIGVPTSSPLPGGWITGPPPAGGPPHSPPAFFLFPGGTAGDAALSHSPLSPRGRAPAA